MFSDTSIGLSVICNPCSATPLRSYTPWSTSNPSQPRLPHHPPAWTSGATELKKKTIKTKCSIFVLKQFCVWLCFETNFFLMCYVTIGVCVIVGYFIQWPVDVNLKMTKKLFFVEITLKYYAPFILDEFFQIVKNNWTEIFFRCRRKLFLMSGKTFWIAK